MGPSAKYASLLHDEIEHLKNKLSQLETDVGQREADPFLSLSKVSMNESYRFEYRMHAYQDGNFRELKVERSLSWAQLLAILGNTFIHPTLKNIFLNV